MASFIERVAAFVTAPPAPTAQEQEDILLAFADTMAVVHAGWDEPVTQKTRALYAGTAVALPDGSGAMSPEHAALILGTAGHALDYDDVHLASLTHPSIAIVPALLVGADMPGVDKVRMATAFSVGLAVNVALGRILGFPHYARGWHATSTIGPVAGAAAMAHLFGLDAQATRYALALGAAQAAGFQRNFGAMAKPLQAGFAAQAALRAGVLAQAGITAADDVFGKDGYIELYAGDAGAMARAETVELGEGVSSIARKLYPCCYATHRLIAAGLEARSKLGAAPPPGAEITVLVPNGGLQPLRKTLPRTGLEGKFSAEYTVAAALHQGSVGLADFEDAAVARAPLHDLMGRIRVIEEPPSNTGGPASIDDGSIRLAVQAGGKRIAEAEIKPVPGSPGAPATRPQLEEKFADCLARYGSTVAGAPALEGFMADLQQRLRPAA